MKKEAAFKGCELVDCNLSYSSLECELVDCSIFLLVALLFARIWKNQGKIIIGLQLASIQVSLHTENGKFTKTCPYVLCM